MGFSKKASNQGDLDPELFDNGEDAEQEYPFELLVVDADTPLFRASKFVQEDYIIVKHIPTGKEKEFSNKTEFYGHWKKKDGGWLAEQNDSRREKGLKEFPVEDFEISEHVRLLPDIEDHVEEGVKIFDFFVGNIKAQKLAPDYILCIGGEGNFRYNIAKTLPYKGNRPDKPLLFESIRERILTKYKRKVKVVDGKEAEDELAVYGRENFLHHKKTGEWKYCLAYVDKDLKCIISPHINYDNLEEGVIYNTPLDAAKALGKQLLIGDLSTDNIPGLPELVPELRDKYGVRKGRGLGETTATSYLNSCEDIKEVFERVVEAYRAYYGEDKFEHEHYDGTIILCNWLDRLQEVFLLVYISPHNEPEKAHIVQILDNLGVTHEQN